MSYTLRLRPAPRRRNEGEPAIGVAQAEQLAQQLTQQSDVLDQDGEAAVEAAKAILETVRAQLAEATRQVQGLLDQFAPRAAAYETLYAEVDNAWGEWDDPSESFLDSYTNAITDFTHITDQLEEVFNELPS